MSKYSTSLITLLIMLSFSSSIAQSNSKRFIDNADNTVTDKQTGLIWMKCPIGLSGSHCEKGQIKRMSWLTALDTGINTTHANKSDWRLPSKMELLGLISEPQSTINPVFINTTAFPNTPAGAFWTSFRRRDISRLTQMVNFADGLGYEKDRFQYYYVRLVRTDN